MRCCELKFGETAAAPEDGRYLIGVAGINAVGIPVVHIRWSSIFMKLDGNMFGSWQTECVIILLTRIAKTIDEAIFTCLFRKCIKIDKVDLQTVLKQIKLYGTFKSRLSLVPRSLSSKCVFGYDAN